MNAKYTLGPWVGMAATSMWLVADLDQRDPVVGPCWDLVTGAAPIDQVLAALAQSGDGQNFAIVRLDHAGAEIVVRGQGWAEVVHDSPADHQQLQVRAVPGSLRTEKVDRFGIISLHLPVEAPGDTGAPPPELVVGIGVVPASQLVIHARHREPLLSLDEPEPSGGRFDDMFGKTVHPAEEEPQAAAVPEEWMAGMRQKADVASDSVTGLTLPPVHTMAAPPVTEGYRSPFERPASSLPAPIPSGGNPFTDVSWATLPDVPGGGPDPYDQYLAAHPPPTSYQPPAEFQLPSLPPMGAQSFAAAPPAAQSFAAAPPAAGGGIDPELLQTVQRSAGAPAATGPVVGAVRCGRGHPNPPAATHCRICSSAIPAQTPLPVPRPTLGVLRLSTGEVVPLDRGVILGRAPGAPEGFGRDEPYRIQLPSPDGSISRKHVEVVLAGWLVSVVDLKSTNGTQVIPPGGMPEQLPPGGRRIIDNGWTVSLDVTTSFRFEVTE